MVCIYLPDASRGVVGFSADDFVIGDENPEWTAKRIAQFFGA